VADQRIVHGACPHDCPDTCAMLVTVEDGRAVKVAGDPAHPVTAGALCAKVNDYLERVYSPERLLHPMVRTGPKGAGSFRQATWDEAIDLIAERLLAVREEHGGEAILPYSYLGTQGYLNRDLLSARVFNALGASDLVRTICADAGMAGAMATQGASPEVDPELWPKARFLLVWAWNPQSTAPHLWRFLVQARKAGARMVVVDPFRSRTARVADEHLQPLPGTDAALALGMMRAMVDAGVQDEDWCRAHGEGYDDLLGRLAEWPVERAAEVTGVAEDAIRRIGVEFASTQPSLLRMGVGGQRHAGAPMAYRTIACLPALAGSWRLPGGGFSYIPVKIAGTVAWRGMQGEDLRPGPVRKVNMSAIGDALTDPSLDPPIKAMVCWNANPARVAPDSERVVAGLAREDLFTVVMEQFMTDTARYADVILPATTQLEQLDAVFSWGQHYIAHNAPAIAPLGAAKPNTEVFRLLGARLGMEDELLALDDAALLEAVLATARAPIDVELLRERGWVKVDHGQGPAPHAEGGFGTPDGKLLFRNDGLAKRGMDPLPAYEPPAEVADEALAARFPLALITPKTHFFLNSTFANQARQRGAQGDPVVVVHPDDAARAGVAGAGRVRVWNDRGAFVARVEVSVATRPGVLVAPMGWWIEGGDLGPQATTSQRLTAMAAAPTFNDNRVALEPAP
jgi:anaerobic selenocysteine-containing dehydrogenase